jgi:hypothetical protein
MLTLFRWACEAPFLRFDFSPGTFFDDEGWEHTAVEASLTSCYEGTLLPLACARGEQLTVEEVICAVVDWATGAKIWPTAVDWLGLALYAQLRFRLAVTDGSPPKDQALCRVAHVLQERLEGMHDRLADLVYACLHEAGSA